MWKPGNRNLITDVQGLLVGNARHDIAPTGVSVLTAEVPFVAAAHVMGGAPGTRETDLLEPDKSVQKADAIVLSGGSAFGLDAASGVMAALRKAGRGFPARGVLVPIVPAAVLFDLDGLNAIAPTEVSYADLGAGAFEQRAPEFSLGTNGAGVGATAGHHLRGGLGSASLVLDGGIVVGALVAANPHGSVIADDDGRFWAAPWEIGAEFGGRGVAIQPKVLRLPGATPQVGTNTTLAIVATNADLSQAEAKRMAVAAHDGIARAVVPAHTPFDGDMVFSAATGTVNLADRPFATAQIGHAAALCVSRAIARAIFAAGAGGVSRLPSWRDAYG
ncbi:MAG: P1 family peptidase [Pseudomonadota bacterium]